MSYDTIDSRFEILIFETVQEQEERRLKEKNERKIKLEQIEKNGCCEGSRFPCNCTENVEWTSSRTHYSWDIDKYPLEDPNRPIFLCPTCAIEHHNHWDDMWGEYRASQLGY